MWEWMVKWFKDSETIFWARVQMIIGILAAIVTYVEPYVLEPLLPPEWFPWFVLLNGVLTEYLRRRRDDTLD